MDEKTRLLEVRRIMKKRKPHYMRQTGVKKDKLEKKWIRPRGEQSKLRERKRGHGFRPEPGFGSPRAVEGMTRSGLMPKVVKNVDDLKKLDKKTDGVLIAHIGQRKRVIIIAEAKKLGFTMINVKDADAYIKSVQDDMAARKEQKKKKASIRSDKEKKAEKKAEEKKKKDEESKSSSDEEKKKAEKDEKDKVLTSKE